MPSVIIYWMMFTIFDGLSAHLKKSKTPQLHHT